MNAIAYAGVCRWPDAANAACCCCRLLSLPAAAETAASARCLLLLLLLLFLLCFCCSFCCHFTCKSSWLLLLFRFHPTMLTSHKVQQRRRTNSSRRSMLLRPKALTTPSCLCLGAWTLQRVKFQPELLNQMRGTGSWILHFPGSIKVTG